jgi:hypothetical protein
MADKPGHYNFLFGLEGPTKRTGRLSRQQLKTVYVRPAPDASATALQTFTQSTHTGNQLVITMTPRTKRGDRLGPGWANYFWFTAPGTTPVKAQDHLDGTYTATVPYVAGVMPLVSVHFINVSMVIGNSVTANQLPVPLDNGTVLVPSVLSFEDLIALLHQIIEQIEAVLAAAPSPSTIAQLILLVRILEQVLDQLRSDILAAVEPQLRAQAEGILNYIETLERQIKEALGLPQHEDHREIARLLFDLLNRLVSQLQSVGDTK